MKYPKAKQKKNIRDIPYRLMMSRREFDDLLEESINSYWNPFIF